MFNQIEIALSRCGINEVVRLIGAQILRSINIRGLEILCDVHLLGKLNVLILFNINFCLFFFLI